MERIILYLRTPAKSGEIKVRLRLTEGREVAMFHKTGIRATPADLAKFDIETEVLEPGFPSPITDYNGNAFKLVEKAVNKVLPDVVATPYLMTAASDSRFMSRVCDNCIRFAPFTIDNKQLASVHGIDENVDVDTLAPAVDFYKYVIKEA